MRTRRPSTRPRSRRVGARSRLRILAELTLTDTALTLVELEACCNANRTSVDKIAPLAPTAPMGADIATVEDVIGALHDAGQVETSTPADGDAVYAIAVAGRDRLADPEQDPLEAAEDDLQTCRDCGCTDLEGCPGGCWWVEPDLCSSCARDREPVPA